MFAVRNNEGRVSAVLRVTWRHLCSFPTNRISLFPDSTRGNDSVPVFSILFAFPLFFCVRFFSYRGGGFFFFYEVSGGVRRSIDRQSLRRHPENRQSLKLITTRENEIRVTRKVKRPTGATLQ